MKSKKAKPKKIAISEIKPAPTEFLPTPGPRTSKFSDYYERKIPQSSNLLNIGFKIAINNILLIKIKI